MKKLLLNSLAHFWVDFSCAFLLLPLLGGEGFLVYNFCAFALQMPLGLLADRLDRNRLIAAAGCVLTALAYLSPAPLPAAVTAGVGNALFHLGGGIDTLNHSRGSAAALGVFVSPGALGLWLGPRCALPFWIAPAGLLLLALLLLCALRPSGNAPLVLEAPPASAVLLFLVVALRSYMGMNQNFSWKAQAPLALCLALVLGKAAGGFLMDCLGPRAAAAVSLLPAAGLYLLSDRPLPGLLAVFLFNMTMPVTLWALARMMPNAKGFSFGILTFALFLGYLPAYLDWPPLPSGSCALLALLSLALLWLPLRKEALRC